MGKRGSTTVCISRSQNQIRDAAVRKQVTGNVGHRWTGCLRR